jgi:S-adenosylmethionine hydrolase
MIVLFTDFGLEGPYIGQMKAVLHRKAPNVPIIDLFSDLPPFDVRSAAYLLPNYVDEFPTGTVFLCVVDPGVGSGRRVALVEADSRCYVGPDNGLFNVLAKRAQKLRWWDVLWRPARLSASFHGRDVFAPVAASVVLGEMPPVEEQNASSRILPGWPDDLYQVVYIDRYGNAMTGIRASELARGCILEVRGKRFTRARTFSDVSVGEGFWYENSNGLAEVAVNQGRADRDFGLGPGDEVTVISPL